MTPDKQEAIKKQWSDYYYNETRKSLPSQQKKNAPPPGRAF
jgi:hypothetical protein